jgi:deazaflavin-dependent oxidoreductase (nitroreductase family)
VTAHLADDLHDPWVAPALERGDLGIIETTGARSGATRRTHTGFALRADGSLVIGAAHASTQWPHNLAAHPGCRYAIRGVGRAYIAREVTRDERDAALGDLAAVYGENTPRGGRTFVLEPSSDASGAAAGTGVDADGGAS